MIKITTALAALALPFAAQAQTKLPPDAQPALEKREKRIDSQPIRAFKVILVGDSTMAPGSGWASMFCALHVKSTVNCVNLGRGGRSTRSYRSEGSWTIALNEAKVAGYEKTWVLIQFGHNDQSTRAERWTDLNGEFGANLRQMVADVRAAGAHPVLVTPLTRREFRDGKIYNNLAAWGAEAKRVGAALQVPVIDLNTRSAAIVQRLGAVDSTALAQSPPLPEELAAAKAGTTLKARPAEAARAPAEDLPKTGPRGQLRPKFDYTHVGETGAKVFAKLVAHDFAVAVPELRSHLLP